MDDILKYSLEIYKEAISIYPPYATVVAVSGGDDSLTALSVAKSIGINIDYILHINTRTGIRETTDFVRTLPDKFGTKYIEGDAKNKYIDYVMRKGFFGLGDRAHRYAYHILKRTQLTNCLSTNIRHRKRGRNILLINGVRKQESKRRMITKPNVIDPDFGSRNIWVQLINHWSKSECLDFLSDNKIQRNPVVDFIHHSGECMCGTMQSLEQRREYSFWFPDFGAWLDGLEKIVVEKHGYGWGVGFPKNKVYPYNKDYSSFQPMCVGCISSYQDREQYEQQ